jgi:hypothetical protein
MRRVGLCSACAVFATRRCAHRSTALLSQPPGSPDALLAEPVFEAAFGGEAADCTLGELRGRLLHAELVRALTQPAQRDLAEDYTFPAERRPYRHQYEAWMALTDRAQARSVLVSSGTGSGKTECFLIPILNDLAHELTDRHDGGQQGVRAIFLYPLNALIKSQRERLQAWSEPFGGRVRFCLYNGDTPESARSEDRRQARTGSEHLLLEQLAVEAGDIVHQPDRHGAVHCGLELQQDVEEYTLGHALPGDLHRPHHVLDLLLEHGRNVMAVVLLQRREVHQPCDLAGREAFDQLLNELGVAEQFLVAGIVMLGSHGHLLVSITITYHALGGTGQGEPTASQANPLIPW